MTNKILALAITLLPWLCDVGFAGAKGGPFQLTDSQLGVVVFDGRPKKSRPVNNRGDHFALGATLARRDRGRGNLTIRSGTVDLTIHIGSRPQRLRSLPLKNALGKGTLGPRGVPPKAFTGIEWHASLGRLPAKVRDGLDLQKVRPNTKVGYVLRVAIRKGRGWGCVWQTFRRVGVLRVLK